MNSETRVAIISMIIENDDSVAEVNRLLHDYSEFIRGRMGLPYRERGLNIISVVVDAPQNSVSALSGKLGRLPGVRSKVIFG